VVQAEQEALLQGVTEQVEPQRHQVPVVVVQVQVVQAVTQVVPLPVLVGQLTAVQVG